MALLSAMDFCHVVCGGRGRKPLELKIRGLFVDTRLKEYTTGTAHQVTDRIFVVRRVFCLNDSLPEEATSSPRWGWERGGWLLVDRVTGRITQVTLPEFDSFCSTGSWYSDYIAYCGVSDDGKRLFAVVAQLGRRKPILKKLLGEPEGDDLPDSECPAPGWQRQPTRDLPTRGKPEVDLCHPRPWVDIVNDSEEGEEGGQ